MTKAELLAEIADVPDDTQIWVVGHDGVSTNKVTVVGQNEDDDGETRKAHVKSR